MQIDFHTHCFPDSLAEKAISNLQRSGGVTAHTDGTRDGLINSMQMNGIDYSVLLPIAVTPQQTIKINNASIKNNKKDNLIWFGSVHPYYENWRREIDRLHTAGIPGIKLHPDFQNVFIDDDKTVDIIKYAAKLNMLVTIHGGLDVSFPGVHRSTPRRLHKILPHLKGARIICAHMGGYMYLDDVEKYLLDCDEIYIDTSFSVGKMDTAQIERILTRFDSNKILFGSDSPWDNQAKAVQDIKSLNIPDSLKQKIMYENACRLLNINNQ